MSDSTSPTIVNTIVKEKKKEKNGDAIRRPRLSYFPQLALANKVRETPSFNHAGVNNGWCSYVDLIEIELV